MKQSSKNTGQYAGMVFQWIAGIGIFLFCGIKIDDFLQCKTPLATWILPLFFITGMMIKMIIDTNRKK